MKIIVLLKMVPDVVEELELSADGKALAEGDSVHIVVDSAFKRMHLPGKYMGPLLEAAGKS